MNRAHRTSAIAASNTRPREHRSRPPARRSRGVAALETLVAVPVVLLLGLSALQWALVFHGQQVVSHAAIEAGRAGSLDHASSESIERGLARGLAPWLYGSSGAGDHQVAIARTAAHLARGQSAGWVHWRRLSPAAGSFTDWAETARDENGNHIEGLQEIPNDNLTMRSTAMQPASGTAGYRGSEPVGAASGQTLSDANLLKLEFTYGVPLTVPLVGSVAAWIMRAVDGCGESRRMRLGSVDLGRPLISGAGREWTCAYYEATDEAGRPKPRWPVRAWATVRMQSPARAAAGPGSVANGSAGTGASALPYGSGFAATSLGAGEVAGSRDFEPSPVRHLNPAGATAAQDGSYDRAPGFLKIGADRLMEPPGLCSVR